MSKEKSKQEISKMHYDRLLALVNALLKDSGKTDIDSQIKAIETLTYE